MNDHLIKNLKLSLVWDLLKSFILVSIILYFINSDKPIQWSSLLIYLFFPIYYLFKKKILLEILKTENGIIIKSYSILNGRKDLNLKISEIIELDHYNGFVIKYKNSLGKNTETFQINAEPWNNIYEQIKSLKLSVQESKQTNMKNFETNTTE
ncbi:hypothetical protein [Olleya sp. Bg11-27]|uniref:hypothetical protein n=1 Tax=Olleya sp. Bg11-27 TaxID=2058135 RepID=UPI000C319417|nr:hypothetical protein [Olleya sp. Bg11-27]AUC74908.1 hypothetical protein CW732_04140 [Olleya sp. Bg11-27]